MELAPATPEQVLEFKQGAAARFTKLGIEPKKAEQLFNEVLLKLGEEAGIIPDAERIDKVAKCLADKLGLKRKGKPEKKNPAKSK